MHASYFIIFFLFIDIFLFEHAQAYDNCDNYGVMCGGNCTDDWRYCTCGNNAQNFYKGSGVDGKWCCGGTNCTKDTEGDINCATGLLQHLNQPCDGRCNDYTGVNAGNYGRHYVMCDSGNQCIWEPYWQDGIFHCLDRSDEKKDKKIENGMNNEPDIDWAGLTESECYQESRWYPGLPCSGIGGGCLSYRHWCSDQYSYICEELGGRSTIDPAVCSNTSFWSKIPCYWGGQDLVRCSSAMPGQCFYPGWPCKDESHKIYEIGRSCKSNDCEEESCSTPTPDCTACTNSSLLQCKKNGKKVCISSNLVCDRHPNCDEGEDELDCQEIYKEKSLTPAEGTFECYSPLYHPNNQITDATVLIYAVRCDSTSECWNNEDEKDCTRKLLDPLQFCE